MGYIAKWKVPEDLMIELRKKGVTESPELLNELKSAKLMIKISEAEGRRGEADQQVEAYLRNVESNLMTEAETVLSPETVDQWFRRLEEANAQCEKPQVEAKFIIGVPKDKNWVRVEPIDTLTSDRIKQMAQEGNLSVKPQKDGRLVVFGQQESIKVFLKRMTVEANKK